MMKKRHNIIYNKAYLIASIIFFVLFIACSIVAIIIANTNPELYVKPIFYLSYAFTSPVLLMICAICFATFFNMNREMDNVRLENKFNFGRESGFYNYVLLTKRIKQISKKHKNDDAYIIYFSPSNIEVTMNTERNDDATKLINEIAHFLVDHFMSLPKKEKDKIAYCYYHGCFVIYLFGTEEDAVKFRVKLSDATTNIAINQNLKVYARPIFGIKLVEPDKDLFTNMDDASVARNISEKNYEESTIYSPSFRKSTTKEEIEEIEQAIKNGEFTVYYQPKYLLSSKTYSSSEALVRWNSKIHGVIPPSKFINKAELGGLIHELDLYVFRRVCMDLADQKRRGRAVIPVSINFSQYEFYSPSFLEDIDSIMKEYKIDPYNIQIEITEPTARKNEFMTLAILNKLKARGIKIAMDDFGVGYSNLANLNRLPFDTIKIDKSFIDNIVPSIKTREIVRLLINFCKAAGIEVVAEGVDTKEQVEILQKIKCDTIQGNYFSKPLPKNEYEKLVSKTFQKIDKEGK